MSDAAELRDRAAGSLRQRPTRSLSAAQRRAFVLNHTRLSPLPGLPDIRLHLGVDAMALMHASGSALGLTDPPLPFWAFAWPGGLAIVRYLIDHPDEVVGRRVLDLASGSGLCAIVAARLGAASVDAADVDPFADAAIRLNARANDVRIAVRGGDPLASSPAGYDLVLAGDVCYEETMTARVLAWLGEAAALGERVLLGDPGRTYLPPGLERLGTYEVHASREIEDGEVGWASVYGVPPPERR